MNLFVIILKKNLKSKHQYRKENKYYTILIESKSLTEILNEIGKLMPKSILYKLNYNFENNDNLNAIEFNQIDQRTYFTLQIKCDKIN
jgi:hypothetical protein